VADRDPECYSEVESFNIHVINDAPVIEDPKESTVSMFDGLTRTVILVSSDNEKSPLLELRYKSDKLDWVTL
jgi:hypothetical protein